MEDAPLNFDISPESLEADTKKYIKDICQSVHGCLPSELSPSDLINLCVMDMSTWMIEYTVSTGATRRTEVQYCSNNYHFSTKLDCSAYRDHLIGVLKHQTPKDQVLNRFAKMKRDFYSFIKAKILSQEEQLRYISLEAEEKDGSKGQGRFRNQ